VNVPNVVGKKQGQAEAELQNAGFNVAVVEQPSQAQPGEVISQAPTGTAPEGSTITIYVSAGNGP
jgi:serine/threonine-protein kinase